MDRRLFLGLLVLAAVPVQAASDDPTASVRAAYTHQAAQAKARRPAPAWVAPHRDRFFAHDLAALLAADERHVATNNEMGAVGYDPFLNGQDGAVRGLTLTVSNRSPERATVEARFRSLNVAQTVSFDMRREGDSWRIADIAGTMEGTRTSLRKMLSEAYSKP
jgi:hypothetical protein